MKVNAKSYPYPVLGNEDDIDGVFDVEFHYELSKNEVALHVSFKVRNETIEKLISVGKASYVIETECPATFYRKSFSTKNAEERVSIPAKLLREKVTVGFFICSDTDVKDYMPSKSNPDYGNISFEIEKGDVLATGGHSTFIAEKTFDPLKPPLGSLFTVTMGSHFDGPMEIDYSYDKITLILSKEDYKNYQEIKNQKITQNTLHSSLVFPVLVDAIYQINNGDDFSDMNWYSRLDTILAEKGLKEKDPLLAAQIILDYPEKRNFQSLNHMLEGSQGDDNE